MHDVLCCTITAGDTLTIDNIVLYVVDLYMYEVILAAKEDNFSSDYHQIEKKTVTMIISFSTLEIIVYICICFCLYTFVGSKN